MKKGQNIEKIVLLFTVVSHGKATLFTNFLEDQGVNCQIEYRGTGMHEKKFHDTLNYKKKAVIMSFVSEDKVNDIIKKLENKFETVRYSYGACWYVPLSSVIGVSIYKYLIDYHKGGIQ